MRRSNFVLFAVVVLVSLFPEKIVLAAVSVDQAFEQLPFSASEKKRILNGELVTAKIKGTSDRELAVGMAFVVKTTPEGLNELFLKGVYMDLPEPVKSHAVLPAKASVKDFSGAVFGSDEVDEIQRYLDAAPGSDINMDSTEIKEFRTIKDNKLAAAEAKTAVEEQLHTLLFKRYQTYRSGGLSAIAPYIRDDNNSYYLGKDLVRATQAAQFIRKFYPDFYRTVLDYPRIGNADIQEQYFWIKLISQDRPTFVLTHRFSLSDGKTYAVASRQFYASQSYNSQQELAVFLPVEQRTLVFYLNRTNTDEVAGFGSGTKHLFGTSILAKTLTRFFKDLVQGVSEQ